MSDETHPTSDWSDPDGGLDAGSTGAAIKRAVRDRYAAAARQGSCCVAPAACASGPGAGSLPAPDSGCGTDAVLPGALARELDLGCGNPLPFAGLRQGDTVLDLGSGSGAEVLRAARMVGPAGRAIGVDMTDEMLELARANLVASGLANAGFVKADIERLPLADASVDVGVSNCVLNLSPDKLSALGEAFRVLRPGGRFVVADVVVAGADEPDPAWRDDLAGWSACARGALTEAAYAGALADSGFAEIDLKRIAPGGDGETAGCCGEAEGVRLVSDLITATKPAVVLVGGRAPDARGVASTIRELDRRELPLAEELLDAVGLSPEGLDGPGVRLFGAGEGPTLAGVVAYEPGPGAVLLRSLAVRPGMRGAGTGRALVAVALEQAASGERAREALLLTESAAAFFSAGGWETVPRAGVDARFPASAQVRSVCPRSATAMRIPLPAAGPGGLE